MKIMLDECVTEGPALTLIRFFGLETPSIQAEFLVTYFGKQGLKDAMWADQLASEGDWFVITADRDKKRKSKSKRLADGPPLHTVLPNLGITAVYLSGSIQNAPGSEKARAIVSAWPEKRDFFQNAPAGSRKLLTKHGRGFTLRDY